MSPKIPASVFIICKNEAQNLARALTSVAEFEDLVVVDSGSTDGTLDIARQFPCRRFHQDWLGHAAQKQVALELCRHDWLLNLDADEQLSPELLAEIRRFIAAPGERRGLSIPIREVFIGAAIHPKTHHNRHIRVFNRQSGHYPPAAIHEGVKIDGTVERASGTIIHYGEVSVAVKLAKNNSYSELRAAEKYAKGKQPKLTKLILVFPLMFTKSYLLRGQYRNGWRGFVASMINGFYAFLKEAKLFERHALGATLEPETTAPKPSPNPIALD